MEYRFRRLNGKSEKKRSGFGSRPGRRDYAETEMKKEAGPFGFAFHVRGDNEILALSKALAFASQVLQEQIQKTNR